MNKKTSFCILSNSGSRLKQFTFPNSLIKLFVGFFILFCAFCGYIIYDYMQLKKTVIDNKVLQELILSKSDKITFQNKQIKKIASEINLLKLKLLGLNNFAKKIRIIADQEEDGEQSEESLFGIGGLIPDDISTDIPVYESQSSLIREMHGQMEQLNQAVINQEKDFKDILNHLNYQIDLLGSTPSIRPAKGWFTCGFGYRKSPFTGTKEFHRGVDIANRRGTPIFATANGIVGFAGKKGLMGNMIVIDHGYGMITRYGHASKILVKQGDTVKRGDTIALIGSTGRTTGPHVHYEVFLNGIPVNPTKYFLN